MTVTLEDGSRYYAAHRARSSGAVGAAEVSAQLLASSVEQLQSERSGAPFPDVFLLALG